MTTPERTQAATTAAAAGAAIALFVSAIGLFLPSASRIGLGLLLAVPLVRNAVLITSGDARTRTLAGVGVALLVGTVLAVWSTADR